MPANKGNNFSYSEQMKKVKERKRMKKAKTYKNKMSKSRNQYCLGASYTQEEWDETFGVGK